MSITAAWGADKTQGGKFDPGPLSSFTARQTISNFTIGAKVFVTDEQARRAFGKLNPYRFGVLPILVIMQNDRQGSVSLEHLRVEYITADRERIEATPAQEVKYITGPEKPKLITGPIPRGPGVSRKKNPLAAWEIEGRSFAAKMLPPSQAASGFFYFQATHNPRASLYVRGIRDASSGSELFYFEIPLDKASD